MIMKSINFYLLFMQIFYFETFFYDVELLSGKNAIYFIFKDIFEEDIVDWENDDHLYIETHGFPRMLQKVRNHHFVTFVGSPGSGKSATARHIALILKKEGYSILPVKEIEKIESYCDRNPQVFVIDDVLGVSGLAEEKFHNLIDYQNRLANLQKQNSKVIMTCRQVVYRNEKLKNIFLFKDKNVVLLQSDENSLNDEDKKCLLAKYGVDPNIFSKGQIASSLHMFPYLCKLFSSKRTFQNFSSSFFEYPEECIRSELNRMMTENKIHYASLVLLVANQNQLSAEDLDMINKDNQTILNKRTCEFLDKCNVSHYQRSKDFIEALLEMEETYTKKCGSKFTFIHDSMFEITAHHFGSKFPEFMLQLMDSDFIANNIKLSRNPNDTAKADNNEQVNEIDFSIKLEESQFPLLAQRLYRDVENGELYNVFGNKALKHPAVLDLFIKEMDEKAYLDIYKVFLCELKVALSIRNENQHKNDQSGTDENEYRSNRNNPFKSQHSILINRKYHDVSVRAISWVIFYGHHHILKYIIGRIVTQKGKVDDLFRNRYNKSQRHYSASFHNDYKTENGEDKCTMKDELDENTINIFRRFFSCFGHRGVKNGDLTEERRFSMSSDCTFNLPYTFFEEVIVEEGRLLCLGCYSGDSVTVQILLEHVDKNLNNMHKTSTSIGDIYPLGIASTFGYLEITRELIKAKNDVNHGMFCYRPLVDACYGGNVSVVGELIQAEADVNEIYESDVTPLIAACEVGHIDVVKTLIAAGADPNLAWYKIYGRGKEEYATPTTAACTNGHIDIVKLLIKERVDVNVNKQECGTPLTVACENGHLNVVEVLLQAGADINLENARGQSPIACALPYMHIVEVLITHGCGNKDKNLSASCYFGDLNAVKEFIQAGGNVNSKEGVIVPLLAACIAGQNKVVKELIGAGADINLKDCNQLPIITACEKGHLSVVKELLKASVNLNLKNEYKTPLKAACYGNHVNVVRELIKGGVDVNRDNEVEAPLEIALRKNYIELAQVLIEAKANVNAMFALNETPLEQACIWGHAELVKILIESRADVNLNSPLRLAVSNGYLPIVQYLLENGANATRSETLVNTVSKGRQSPDKCCEQLLSIVQELIKDGANLNFESERYKSPLALASKRGYLSVVKELIKAEVDVNYGEEHKPPLTYACLKGHLSVVKELIKAGADVNLNKQNKTPLTAACFKGHLDVVEMLIKDNANVNLGDGIKTPLIAALDECYLEIFKTLINAGADVNYIYRQNAPLIVACRGQGLLFVQELIKADANVNLTARKQRSPLEIAYEYSDPDLINMLIEAGANDRNSGCCQW